MLKKTCWQTLYSAWLGSRDAAGAWRFKTAPQTAPGSPSEGNESNKASRGFSPHVPTAFPGHFSHASCSACSCPRSPVSGAHTGSEALADKASREFHTLAAVFLPHSRLRPGRRRCTALQLYTHASDAPSCRTQISAPPQRGEWSNNRAN